MMIQTARKKKWPENLKNLKIGYISFNKIEVAWFSTHQLTPYLIILKIIIGILWPKYSPSETRPEKIFGEATFQIFECIGKLIEIDMKN